MTKEEMIKLIKDCAPILWLHEDEDFFPESCEVMQNKATFGTSPNNRQVLVSLDQLGNLKNSDEYYLDIPDIDFSGFGMNSNYRGTKIGPDILSVHVRNLYGKNAKKFKPQYHARVSKIKITDTGDNDSRIVRNYDQKIFGDYNVIQYYFFYIFNDSWNKHVSDWDSTLEVFIKEDNSRAYAIFYMHHITWTVKLSFETQNLKQFIDNWNQVEKKRQMGVYFQHKSHPFVFVAEGAHGGYPTPGFSVHGSKLSFILKFLFIGQTDYRQIGKTCILPDETLKKDILDILKKENIDTSKTYFIPWEEPIVLDKQPWLKYKGLWGTKPEYLGWGGSEGPSKMKCWRMDQRRFKREIIKGINGDYTGDWPFKILLNWHGWR